MCKVLSHKERKSKMTSSTFLTIWIAMFAVITVMTIALAIAIKIKWDLTPTVTVITSLTLMGGLVAVGWHLFKQGMANPCFFTILTILIAIFAMFVATIIAMAMYLSWDLISTIDGPVISLSYIVAFLLEIRVAFILMAGLIAVGMLFLGQNITNPVWLVLIATFETIVIVREFRLFGNRTKKTLKEFRNEVDKKHKRGEKVENDEKIIYDAIGRLDELKNIAAELSKRKNNPDVVFKKAVGFLHTTSGLEVDWCKLLAYINKRKL